MVGPLPLSCQTCLRRTSGSGTCCFWIERGEPRHGADEEVHRMRVVPGSSRQPSYILLEKHVQANMFRPLVELRFGREFGVENQVRDFEIGTGLGKLLKMIPFSIMNY